MKKILTSAICLALFTLAASTATAQQKGDMAWGLQGAYASGNGLSNIGFGAKFRYNVTDPIRLEGAFTYYLKQDFVSLWDLSANAHWLFPVAGKVTIYPLAGLGMYGVKAEVLGFSASDSDLGLNIGGGADFRLSEKTAVTAELKYSTAIERIVLSAGVSFRF